MDNGKKIWDILLANGCTEAGAAGVIGNMEAESGLVPCRLQGDFTNGYTASIAYAAKVDSGKMTRNQFAYDTTGGGGWGLCQWTYWSRKAELFDYCKMLGASIGDLTAQVKFFCKECKENYSEVWKTISKTDDVQAASDAVLLKFERPADMYNKRAYRGSRSRYYYDLLTSGETGEEVAEIKPATVSVVLPVLEKGCKNGYVSAAQAMLIKRGIFVGVAGADGDFGNGTYNGVVKFQKKNDLSADGIIGEETWSVLLRG